MLNCYDMIGTFGEFERLFRWLHKNKPDYLKYMYDIPTVKVPIASFPEEANKWLWKNCRNKTVRRELKKQYSEKILKRFENEDL